MSGRYLPKEIIAESTLSAAYHADRTYVLNTSNRDQAIFYIKYESTDNDSELIFDIAALAEVDDDTEYYRDVTEDIDAATGIVTLNRKEYSYFGSDGDEEIEYFTVVFPCGDTNVRIRLKEVDGGDGFGKITVRALANFIGPG